MYSIDHHPVRHSFSKVTLGGGEETAGGAPPTGAGKPHKLTNSGLPNLVDTALWFAAISTAGPRASPGRAVRSPRAAHAGGAPAGWARGAQARLTLCPSVCPSVRPAGRAEGLSGSWKEGGAASSSCGSGGYWSWSAPSDQSSPSTPSPPLSADSAKPFRSPAPDDGIDEAEAGSLLFDEPIPRKRKVSAPTLPAPRARGRPEPGARPKGRPAGALAPAPASRPVPQDEAPALPGEPGLGARVAPNFVISRLKEARFPPRRHTGRVFCLLSV